MTLLTVTWFGSDQVAWLRGFRLSSSVHCNHAELVFLSFGQVGHSGVRLGWRNVNRVHPIWAAFLLLLNYIFRYWGATIAARSWPLQVDVIFVPIRDLWFSRSVRFV